MLPMTALLPKFISENQRRNYFLVALENEELSARLQKGDFHFQSRALTLTLTLNLCLL